MRYHITAEGAQDAPPEELELSNEEFCRILTHLVNMDRIQEKPELSGSGPAQNHSPFQLVSGDGPLLHRFRRPPPPQEVRHWLREADGGGETRELPLSPMEYRLLRQMILSTRELDANRSG